jgi:hypothetical protein
MHWSHLISSVLFKYSFVTYNYSVQLHVMCAFGRCMRESFSLFIHNVRCTYNIGKLCSLLCTVVVMMCAV